MTIHACQAGKDVYCEKPLMLTIAEGRAIVHATRKQSRIVQTDSQQRSDARFRQACELVRSGALGKWHTIKVGLPGPNWIDRAKMPVPDSDPSPGLDYDLWLGPAPSGRITPIAFTIYSASTGIIPAGSKLTSVRIISTLLSGASEWTTAARHISKGRPLTTRRAGMRRRTQPGSHTSTQMV
jgi:hypothetical protein